MLNSHRFITPFTGAIQIVLLLLGAFVTALALAEEPAPAKALFSAVDNASDQPTRSYGGYSKGCLAGGVQLTETGTTWQAMRLSRNRNWAHQNTVDFVMDLSAIAAQEPGWSGLYIGDMSQPRGGPMSSGHKSHQTGLDVDIWMLPPDNLTLTREQRESISSISTRKNRGAYVNDQWTTAHHNIVKAAAQDPRVARIFIFPGAKVQMCNTETVDKQWLRKVRPWFGHHYHFHVRLHCPEGDSACEDQTAPPAGDGCAEAESWVQDILNPKPRSSTPAKKKPDLLLSDLPEDCAMVLSTK